MRGSVGCRAHGVKGCGVFGVDFLALGKCLGWLMVGRGVGVEHSLRVIGMSAGVKERFFAGLDGWVRFSVFL